MWQGPSTAYGSSYVPREDTKKLVDLKEYGVELAGNMSDTWELARQCIRKAQKKQKDQKGRPANFRVGE